MYILPKDAVSVFNARIDDAVNYDGSGLHSGVGALDKLLNPFVGGITVTILARPSNGKSMLIQQYARQAALNYKTFSTKFVPPVFVSLESSIEEIMVRNVANYTVTNSTIIQKVNRKDDADEFKRAASKFADEYPMFYIGYSSYNKNRQNRISVDSIINDIDEIQQKYNRPISALCLDYIQLVHISGHSEKRPMIEDAIYTLKTFAKNSGFPFIMAAQANRDAETNQNFPIPQPHHCKDTGVIEEASDVILSCMRPIKYWKVGEAIPHTKDNLICSEYLYYIYTAKQRDGISDIGTWVNMDARIGAFSDMEVGD